MTFAKFCRTATLRNTCERFDKKEQLIKPKVKINSQIVNFNKKSDSYAGDSCKFCEIFLNAFFTEHFWASPSEKTVSILRFQENSRRENSNPENSYPSDSPRRKFPRRKFVPRKFPPGIFPPISLIVFLHLTLRSETVYMYNLLPGQKVLISPGRLTVL